MVLPPGRKLILNNKKSLGVKTNDVLFKNELSPKNDWIKMGVLISRNALYRVNSWNE